MKFRLLVIAFILISLTVSAQREIGEQSSFFDRVYLGGNFGAQFGTTTFVDVSPLVGYMITDKLSAGVGITYHYLKFRAFDQSYTTYGYRSFVRRNLGQQFFAQVEYENINRPFINLFTGEEVNRFWVPGLLVGGGYFQRIGNRSGFMLSAFYNFLWEEGRSLSQSPVVLRVGLTF